MVSHGIGTLVAASLVCATVGAQVAWQPITTASAPSPRYAISIAPEPAAGMLLFGGYGTLQWNGETWRLSGATWQQLQPAHTPTPRSGNCLAYDLLRNRTVLFGGNDGFSTFDETWEWDGIDWTQAAPALRPPARTLAAMCFDLLRARMVLFGGTTVTSANLPTDTWEWNGVNWSQVATVTRPAARFGTSIAFDLATGSTLMFGGLSFGNQLADTWSYDGIDWRGVPTSHSPTGRSYAAMTFDLSRARCVLFGGDSGGAVAHGDTWDWDGSDWQQRQPNGPLPPLRLAAAMTFEQGTGNLVLFGGGATVSGTGLRADTWTLVRDPLPTATSYGSGCAGIAGTPRMTSFPASVGGSLQLTLDQLPSAPFAMLILGTSRTSWGATPLPLALASLGMPGCLLLASADATLLLPSVNGRAALTAPIPPQPAFAGLHLFAQGAALDASANAAGAIFSNGVELVLGGS